MLLYWVKKLRSHLVLDFEVSNSMRVEICSIAGLAFVMTPGIGEYVVYKSVVTFAEQLETGLRVCVIVPGVIKQLSLSHTICSVHYRCWGPKLIAIFSGEQSPAGQVSPIN